MTYTKLKNLRLTYAIPLMLSTCLASANEYDVVGDVALSYGQFSADSNEDTQRSYSLPEVEHSLFMFHLGGLVQLGDGPLSLLFEGRIGTGGEHEETMEISGVETESTLNVQNILGFGARIEAGGQEKESAFAFGGYNWDRVSFEVESRAVGFGTTDEDTIEDEVSGGSPTVGVGYRFEKGVIELGYEGLAGSDIGDVWRLSIRGREF